MTGLRQATHVVGRINIAYAKMCAHNNATAIYAPHNRIQIRSVVRAMHFSYSKLFHRGIVTFAMKSLRTRTPQKKRILLQFLWLKCSIEGETCETADYFIYLHLSSHSQRTVTGTQEARNLSSIFFSSFVICEMRGLCCCCSLLSFSSMNGWNNILPIFFLFKH